MYEKNERKMKLTSRKAYQVVRYILVYQKFSQREIARKSNVSLGYINEVINYLVNIGIVEKTTKGFILWDKIKLLEKISFDRPFTNLEIDRFRLPTINIQDTEKEISQTLQKQNKEYAFTVFSGLRHYFEYHLGYPTVHFYIENENVTNLFERGEGPIQVIVLRADLENIMKNKKKIEGFYVCDKEQIMVDLFSSGIGRDAAIKFLEAT